MKKSDPIAPLKKITTVATKHAVEAMTKLIGQETVAATSTVRFVPIEKVLKEINDSTRVSSIIVIKIQGDVQGLLFFSIDPVDAQLVVKDTIKKLAPNSMYTDQEQTVLSEIANVVAGAMLSSIAKPLNLQLEQSPPFSTVDMPGAALDPFLAEFGTRFAKVLIQQDVFVIPARTVSLKVLAIIDPPSTDRMLKKIKRTDLKNAEDH